MGCLKLTYYDSEETLEKSSLFIEKGLEKNARAQKKCVTAYRYGFNGQERDNEWKGDGNSIAYEARIYDPRLGRFLSVDPLISSYSWETGYSFAANSPIQLIDVEGKHPGVYIVYEGGVLLIEIVASYFLIKTLTDAVIEPMLRGAPAYASYSPEYDWQRRREKAGKVLRDARDVAMMKSINDMLPPDDDDPFKFNKIKGKSGVAAALVLGGLELLADMQDYVSLLMRENDVEIENSEAEKQAYMNELGDTELTSSQRKKIIKMDKHLDKLYQKKQAYSDALDTIDQNIEAEKQNVQYNDPMIQRNDTTNVVTPVKK